jgi:uncharacterized protein YggE
MHYLKPAALIAAIALTACEPVTPETMAPDEIKTLRVVGVGEVEVDPDQFVLSGAIIKQSASVRDNSARDAMNALADVVNAVQASASDDATLTSSEFNFASVNTIGVKDPACLLFNQEADRTNATLRDGERRVAKRVCDDVAQQASLSFTFAGGPPDRAGGVIADFATAGAIRLTLDGYRIADLDAVELQAGERAIANAREKAERLAAAGGAKITGVLDLNAYNATYDQGSARPPSIDTSGAGETTSMTQGGDPVTVTEMNLSAGKQVVSAAIELEFTYE